MTCTPQSTQNLFFWVILAVSVSTVVTVVKWQSGNIKSNLRFGEIKLNRLRRQHRDISGPNTLYYGSFDFGRSVVQTLVKCIEASRKVDKLYDHFEPQRNVTSYVLAGQLLPCPPTVKQIEEDNIRFKKQNNITVPRDTECYISAQSRPLPGGLTHKTHNFSLTQQCCYNISNGNLINDTDIHAGHHPGTFLLFHPEEDEENYNTYDRDLRNFCCDYTLLTNRETSLYCMETFFGQRIIDNGTNYQPPSIDMNECTFNNGGCEHICINEVRSYHGYCSCHDGYSLQRDEKGCSDTNECEAGSHNCTGVAQCQNEMGYFRCTCPNGYQLDESYAACNDTNECSVRNGGCEHICINEVGSYHCACQDGYALLLDGNGCSDVNECLMGNHNCTGQASCHNEIGYFRCTCPHGYQLDTTYAGCEELPTPTAGSCCACATSCFAEQKWFEADLTSGVTFTAPDSGITFLKSLTSPHGSSSSCNKQGVIQIRLPPTFKRQLKFELYFNTPTGWNFNIGDSSNNGYGGDAGHTSNAAEVHNINGNFFVYTNTLPGYNDYSVDNHLRVDNIPNAMTNHVTVTIGDEFVEFDNNRGLMRRYRSEYLFTLSGQQPTYGIVNYDLFFGMNRVIYPYGYASRTGTGLCRAVIMVV